MKVLQTKSFIKSLNNAGFGFFKTKKRHFKINKNSTFELPCFVADADLGMKMEIGAFTYFGKGFKNYSEIKIGRFCSIAEDVKIGLFSHPIDRFSTHPFFYKENRGWNKNFMKNNDLIFYKDNEKVVIGDDVWIGANVCIKGGLKIGTGAIIACGAVVTKDVADYAIVAGVPATIIKYRENQSGLPFEYYRENQSGIPFEYYKDDLRGVLKYEDFKKLSSLRKRISSWFCISIFGSK